MAYRSTFPPCNVNAQASSLTYTKYKAFYKHKSPYNEGSSYHASIIMHVVFQSFA